MQNQSTALHPNAFFRLTQIIPAIIPVGKTTWWAGIKSGRYPQPIKLSPRVTVWRASDIYALVENGVTNPGALDTPRKAVTALGGK